jgi:hypothetical protein
MPNATTIKHERFQSQHPKPQQDISISTARPYQSVQDPSGHHTKKVSSVIVLPQISSMKSLAEPQEARPLMQNLAIMSRVKGDVEDWAKESAIISS